MRVAVGDIFQWFHPNKACTLDVGFFLYTPYVHTMMPFCRALRQPFTQVFKLSQNIRHLIEPLEFCGILQALLLSKTIT